MEDCLWDCLDTCDGRWYPVGMSAEEQEDMYRECYERCEEAWDDEGE